jgi:hypothetical protein
MQSHSEKPLLRPDEDLVDGYRCLLFACGWINTGHAPADTLCDPQKTIRSPCDLPRRFKAGRENLTREGWHRLNRAPAGPLRCRRLDFDQQGQEGNEERAPPRLHGVNPRSASSTLDWGTPAPRHTQARLSGKSPARVPHPPSRLRGGRSALCPKPRNSYELDPKARAKTIAGFDGTQGTICAGPSDWASSRTGAGNPSIWHFPAPIVPRYGLHEVGAIREAFASGSSAMGRPYV